MNTQENGPIADWTIMVYIAADYVLDNFAIESLKQMKRAAGNRVVVAAQFDAAGSEEIRRCLVPIVVTKFVARSRTIGLPWIPWKTVRCRGIPLSAAWGFPTRSAS